MNESVSERAKNALRDIGLTEYETKVYLFLLQVGVATASYISKHAGVPYSKIYEILSSLEKKGWVKPQAGRPKSYYPRSPAEALEAERLRLTNRIEAWRKAVIEELQPLYDRREFREKPDVWILRGEYDAFAKLREMIGNAEKEIMVAVPTLTKPLIAAVLPLLSELNGDIRLSIMLSKDQNLDAASLLKFGEVRTRANMFGGGIIVDSREALLILGEKGSSLIVWSDHLGLVKFAKDYFQYLWDTAEKFEGML